MNILSGKIVRNDLIERMDRVFFELSADEITKRVISEFQLIDVSSYGYIGHGDRREIGASSLGNLCEREEWIKYNYRDEVDYALPLGSTKAFTHGNLFEIKAYALLKMIGATILAKNDPITIGTETVITVKTWADIIADINGITYLIECKTANNKSFNRFVSEKDGLELSSYQYWVQIQTMLLEHYADSALIFIENKDNGKFYIEEVPRSNNFKKIYFDPILEKLVSLVAPSKPASFIQKMKCDRCGCRNFCDKIS